MLEAYSKNVTVVSATEIPLNNVSLDKGCNAKLQGTATIQLNQKGVYRVSVNASLTANEAGVVSIQLEKDGILQPQAISIGTAAETPVVQPLGFTTLVQVSRNSVSCCCTNPVKLSVINGNAATINHIDVVVDKVC